jgi:hypothetical protein
MHLSHADAQATALITDPLPVEWRTKVTIYVVGRAILFMQMCEQANISATDFYNTVIAAGR